MDFNYLHGFIKETIFQHKPINCFASCFVIFHWWYFFQKFNLFLSYYGINIYQW